MSAGDDAASRGRALMEKLDREARAAGYQLNPDEETTRLLCEGLAVNAGRYGYPLCPCRLTGGSRPLDLDVICPCDYRDADLSEHGVCYCGLYVSEEVAAGRAAARAIPERRPPQAGRSVPAAEGRSVPPEAGRKIWRCRVCGYLCAAGEAPGKCPICKADRDRFEPFSLAGPSLPVWRCKVCGYLSAAAEAPLKCPICKVERDRFERFA